MAKGNEAQRAVAVELVELGDPPRWENEPVFSPTLRIARATESYGNPPNDL